MQPLTITLIQTDLHWENKAANLQMLEKKIKSIDTKTELVILPEMFSTGFSMKPELLAESMEDETIYWMKRIATEMKIVLTGSIIIKEEENYYNRLVWVLPNGQIGYYDKRHLFGFANEHEHYQSGNKRFVAQVNGWKINLQICYDLRFPVWARQAKADEYDVLINIANWPERRSHAWKTLLCARAIENQSYVVGVNRVGNDGNDVYHSGNSMVVDPMGQVLYHKSDEEDVYTFTLEKSILNDFRKKYPFLKDADQFNIIN